MGISHYNVSLAKDMVTKPEAPFPGAPINKHPLAEITRQTDPKMMLQQRLLGASGCVGEGIF